MREIEICAYLSMKSYDDSIKLEGYNSTFITHHSAQAHIVWSPSTIYVVFRGSSDTSDTVTNLRFWRKNDLHIGFLEQFKAIEARVNAVLEPLVAGRVIVFTGHSLGGSLALIAAHNSPYRNQVYRVFTFGAARPGGRTFRKRYGHLKYLTWNVITPGDPVPRLLVFRVTPGRKLLMGYGTFVKEPSSFRMWTAFIRTRSLDEHSISAYFKYIKLNWSNICKNY